MLFFVFVLTSTWHATWVTYVKSNPLFDPCIQRELDASSQKSFFMPPYYQQELCSSCYTRRISMPKQTCKKHTQHIYYLQSRTWFQIIVEFTKPNFKTVLAEAKVKLRFDGQMAWKSNLFKSDPFFVEWNEIPKLNWIKNSRGGNRS